jgi:hypothetical protein
MQACFTTQMNVLKTLLSLKQVRQCSTHVECEVFDALIDQMFEVHGDDVHKVCLKLARKVVSAETNASSC